MQQLGLDPRRQRLDLWVTIGAMALQLGLLAVDVATPLGYSDWVLQLLPVALALLQRRRNVPYLLVALAAVYTALGYWLSPKAGLAAIQVSIVNRAVGVAADVLIAVLVAQVLDQRERVRRQLWLQQTEAALASALSGELGPAVLAETACGVLCKRVGAEVAVLYRLDGERLTVAAGHAVELRELPAAIALGEGLLGQSVRDGEVRLLSPAPEGHLRIGTALGHGLPRHLLVVPLQADARAIGAIEMAFASPEVDRTLLLELAQRIGEVVGVALQSALYREQLRTLLEETQRQSEELQAQQEELRVSNEELEEQARALRESQAELETQQSELERVNAQLAQHARALERNQAELLHSQAELQANAVALEAASRYKSEFLANMSHELRTPLNSSLILSRLLIDNKEGTLGAEQVRYAQAIHDANNDLLLLINDILDLSKIEAGHAELQVEAVAIADLVERLRAQFEPAARHKGLQLRVEIDPAAPALLRTDGQRLAQVLKNLLSNAVKFTADGEVVLGVRPGARGAGAVRFDVRDTGPGIPADKHEVIFEAFRQADGSTSRQFGGTGLGLAISRELVVRMGGAISLVSAPGRGSTFAVELPAELPSGPEPAEPPAAPPPAAPPPAAPVLPPAADLTLAPPGPAVAAPAVPGGAAPAADGLPGRPGESGRRVVLAVEDDDEFAALLKDLIDEAGFDGVVATDGAQAIEFARRFAPVGILLDVGLPDVSGLSVLERLKRDPATRHIPVHIVSAAERSLAALEMGAVGHLVKPVPREELARAIRGLKERLERPLRRVLVVEDDAALRRHLELLLGAPQLEITTVGSVREALAALATTSFDCMVTDLSLPDGSGFDLLERMTHSGGRPLPPVIVYTGRALGRDEETRLRRYSRSIIVKGARSPERLLDEVTLFLHSVESALPSEQQRLLKAARQRDAVLEGRRILLAEDDVRNIFALTSVFEPLGVELEVARNGREALERLDRGPEIDLVLMDIMMPEMDGLTAMREIRKRPDRGELPIIALTAKAMADDRLQCLTAGANDYIAKPIDVDRLVSLCRVWMPK